MGIENSKEGRLLYHLTKLSNIDSILKNGLLSRRLVKDRNIAFDDVADSNIISRRTELGLDEYIPFHFHPFSAFDVAVKSTYYEEEFIYICIRRELARSKRFKILPKHPLSVAECVLFEYDEGFSKIDWDTMQAIGVNDEYAKNVKMAECLTDLVIPVNWFYAIYVKSKDTVLLIKDKLDEYGIRFPPPYVETQIWF